jgi:hypothetical protein
MEPAGRSARFFLQMPEIVCLECQTPTIHLTLDKEMADD